ncbi:MAG: glk [Acidimicrobiales bacterium]|nr:glk [Acidimicrobiales bacterium]
MPTIGLDVGGTKVLGVVLDDDAAVVAERKEPTRRDAAGLLEGLVAVATELRREAPAATALGVGLPGLVDRHGTLRFAPNLPGIVELPVGPTLAEAFGLPVRADNDATCAAWAEHQLGAAAGADTALLVTLGTGIGGGLVVDGLLVRGANGFAGEVGHMVVDDGGIPCTCGRRGCWERYASGTALGQQARALVAEGGGTRLVELAGGDPAGVTGEHVTTAAAEGDADAVAVLAGFADWFALGLANLIHAFDPSRCVIGGGLVAAGDVVFGPIRTALADVRLVAPEHRPPVEVVPATLGARAGAIGAALLARQVSPGRGQPG